ncbi:MAG: glycerol-3-phosphate dehydrogenase [Chlamydiales bacterium]|jgi:glycerol-3-phosphate dehydrogenase
MSTDEVDVLVVGAGIQGVGVAQAAAAAGHSVLVLEQARVAFGTSSKSSKLIHGGLRYLETFQLSLVRESLRERATLLRVAPHLVRLVPFHIPIYDDTSRHRWQIRAGLSLYALLGGLSPDTRFRTLARARWEELDGLRTTGLKGVFRYFDGQTDDARLARTVLRSAEDLGARVAMPAEMLAAQRQGDGWNIRYEADGHEQEIRGRVLVNAAGPWANRVRERIHPRPPGRDIDLVGGTHVELEGTLDQGIYYTEAPSDRRAVFAMPWRGHILVGTTEREYTGDPASVKPTEAEISYLESTFEHYFPGKGSTRIAAWAGLRVLPQGKGKAFTRPREVLLTPDDPSRPRALTIYGGKLTGYRHTAERVARELEKTLGRAKRKADPATLPLPIVD